MIFIKFVLRFFPCASAVLEYSRLAVVGYLVSYSDIFPSLLLVVSLYYHLGLWVWSDSKSNCQFLNLCFLDGYGCFDPDLLFSFWSSDLCDLWLSKGSPSKFVVGL